MANKVIYKGTDAEVKITLAPDNNAFQIGDATSVPELTAKFYISGTLYKSGAVIVEIDRDDTENKQCYPVDNDSNSLIFHVDTAGMANGTLCCTLEGKYVDTEHDDVLMDFVYSVACKAEIKDKAL